jgi:hypothetical protein
MIRAFGAHCQDRTHALQQLTGLQCSLDGLVGAGEQRWPNGNSQQSRGLQIQAQWSTTHAPACDSPTVLTTQVVREQLLKWLA